MTHKVVDTTNWQWEDLKPYTPAITAAARTFCEKFPDDMTPEALAEECFNGTRRLWLVLGDNDEFEMFFTTLEAVIPSTGKRLITASTLAGKNYKEAFPDMNRVLEAYAATTQADIMQIQGRKGHEKMLREYGFEVHSVIYRKKVSR